MSRPAMPVATRATDATHTRAGRSRSFNRPHRARRSSRETESLALTDFNFGPLFAHTREAVVVVNVDTERIVLWNPAAERLLGWSAREGIGQLVGELISPAVVPLHLAALALREPDAAPHTFELSVTGRDRQALHCELELLALEGGIARHAYVLLLLRERAAPVARPTQPDAAHATSFSASPRRQVELVRERLNLVPLVAEVVGRMRVRGTAHRFNTALPQGLTASVNRARFERLVEALVEHAVARCSGGCWIDVDLRRPLTGQARLEVRDFGGVVSDSDRHMLLAGGADDPNLAAAREMVESHGGELRFEMPDDGGVRAVVTLPTQRVRVAATR